MIAPLALLLATAATPIPVLHGAKSLLQAVHSRHRPTIVHFWATWCGTCVDEIEEVQRLTDAAVALGVDVAFISLDDPNKPSVVADYLQDKHLLRSPQAWAAILDAPDPAPVAAAFHVKWSGGLPATFFLLESGAVAASHFGPTPVDVILKEIKDRAASRPLKN
jgi:thiol-disulfide isomerase/thioredoxin